jgi:arginyl-tRNA synthetase
MDMFTDILLNAGPIGLLAAYMMYWLQKQEAKHDNLTSQYIKKIEELQIKDELSRDATLQKYEDREDKLRQKYDDVIAKLDEERKSQDKHTSKNLEKAVEKLENLGVRFDDLSTKIINTNQKLVLLEQQVQRMDGVLDGIKTTLSRQ